MAYADPLAPIKDNAEHRNILEIENMQKEGNRVQFFGTNAENSGLIITHKDGRISVVYKGTNSLRNLGTDGWANLAIDKKTGYRCHNGIMEGFYRTSDQVFAILDQIASIRGKSMAQLINSDVTVTGHSLGSGLSAMFMSYVHKVYSAAPKAITFATPRVFDVSSSEELDKVYGNKYLNIMQETDPVPGIAFGLFGYKHFGTKMHLPYSKMHLQHKMGGYLAALQAMAQGEDRTIKVNGKKYGFVPSKKKEFGNSTTIGNSYVPNPLYPVHKGIEAIHRNVSPVVHKVASKTKDGVFGAVSSAYYAAKGWLSK